MVPVSVECKFLNYIKLCSVPRILTDRGQNLGTYTPSKMCSIRGIVHCQFMLYAQSQPPLFTSYYQLISCPHQATTSSSVVPIKLLPAHQLSPASYYQLISCPQQATASSSVVHNNLLPAYQLSPSSYYQLISCPHQATNSSSVVPTKLLPAHQLSPPSYYQLISCPHQVTTSSSVVPIKLLPAHQLSPSNYYQLITLEQEFRRFIYVKRATIMDPIFWCGLPPSS